jgi:hypothetical protein
MSNAFLQISNAEKVSREAIPHLSFDEFRGQALGLVTNGGKTIGGVADRQTFCGRL